MAVKVKKDITSLRSTLDWLRSQEGELLTTNVEVDPALEMAGIEKALDAGPTLLFENVKGYPDKRLLTNLMASNDRIHNMFDCKDFLEFKHRIMQGLNRPLPPKVVKDAPCQEVVYTKDLDLMNTIPLISHTTKDPHRTLGGGNTLVVGKYFWGGSHISYNRMSFRDYKNYSSFQVSPGSHTDMIVTEWYRKAPIPMTINMGVPPACTLQAGSGFMYMVLPKGCDELGVAGVIQGSPVEIVKAVSQPDCYALAQAEIVIEGYLDTSQHVWETEQAEREQKQGVFPFHPEWSGYLGRAYRTYKFQVTAVTMRKDRPIYYPTIVHGYDDHNIDTRVREGCFMEMAERIRPGFVVDCTIPLGLTDWGGVVFQVRKRMKRDDGFQKNILATAIAASQGMRMAIAVDTDIDIYQAEDILWAITTRVDADEDIQIIAPHGVGQTFQPAERSAAAPGAQWVRSESVYKGGIALDATVPFEYIWAYERPAYPVDRVDLKKWFSQKEIDQAWSKMHEYARYLAKTGL